MISSEKPSKKPLAEKQAEAKRVEALKEVTGLRKGTPPNTNTNVVGSDITPVNVDVADLPSDGSSEQEVLERLNIEANRRLGLRLRHEIAALLRSPGYYLQHYSSDQTGSAS